MSLPADFLFSVSTASYQIEGPPMRRPRRAAWDDPCDQRVIVDGSSGAVACSYHRYAEDGS